MNYSNRNRLKTNMVVALAIGALAFVSWVTPTAAQIPERAVAKCGGQVATIVGTPNDDVLEGTAGDDVIVGLGGNDKVQGGGGNDIICGGNGKDQLVGGAGDDRMFGNGGNDVLIGGGGNDTLEGQGGRDRLSGGPGDDVISGGAKNDKLLGGGQDDVLRGGNGRDVCRGGSGTDEAHQCETEAGIEGEPESECHPAYVECLPIVDDLNCSDIGFVVHLKDPNDDPYGLDGSPANGIGCESYA